MTNQISDKLLECALGTHEFTTRVPTLSRRVEIWVCQHCGRKGIIKWKSHGKVYLQGICDLVGGRLVHVKYREDYEKWLSNGSDELVYDKRGDRMRKKKQYWKRTKPKNWKYEGMLI